MAKKQLTGKVISNKMQKTAVVEVERIKEHPKYRKRYKVHKHYKVHDEKGELKMGDVIIFEECRPISKGKSWKLKRIISSLAEEEFPEIEESKNEEAAEEIKEELKETEGENKEEKKETPETTENS